MASLHSFGELLQRNRSYLKQKGRGKDHSNVVVRVYFCQAEICVFINTGPKTCGAFSSTLLTECQAAKLSPEYLQHLLLLPRGAGGAGGRADAAALTANRLHGMCLGIHL